MISVSTVLGGIAFLAGAVMGYTFSLTSALASAFIGGLLLMFVAHALCALLWPESYLQEVLRRGHADVMRVSPVFVTLLVGALYLIFEDLLRPIAFWGAAAFLGVLFGLIAFTRTLRTIVRDDP